MFQETLRDVGIFKKDYAGFEMNRDENMDLFWKNMEIGRVEISVLERLELKVDLNVVLVIKQPRSFWQSKPEKNNFYDFIFEF